MPRLRHPPIVYLIRTLHFAIGITMTAATAVLWVAAVSGRVGRWTTIALVLLSLQWIVVALAHGHCPLGGVHRRYGDEKTLFELVAGKAYAVHGFRNWGVICSLGLLVLLVRLLLRV